MKDNFQVHVLLRCSKKTGKIDTTMTGMGSALMKIWAMNNTPATKKTFVLNRETGDIVFMVTGNKDGLPKVEDARHDELGNCYSLGITVNELKEIGYDDRFDKE